MISERPLKSLSAELIHWPSRPSTLGDGGSLGDCFDEEARNHTLSAQTHDHREAAAAFVEKRAPAFTGT